MTRCNECNSLVTRDEFVCGTCGAQTQPSTASSRRRKKFVTFLSVLLYTSLILTVAAIFLPMTPPFSKCLVVSIVLLLVRSSASEMVDKLE